MVEAHTSGKTTKSTANQLLTDKATASQLRKGKVTFYLFVLFWLVIDRYIGRPDIIGRYSRFLRVSVSADTRLIFADIFFEIIYKQASTQAAPCC